MVDDIKPAQDVLRRACNKLLEKSNVVATGIGYKTTAGEKSNGISIICSVEKKLPRSQLSNQDLVPQQIDGVTTDVVESGHIRALNMHTQRHRPAPGGVSIGHRGISAGTLGCVAKRNGKRVILSNNHVLANSNDAQIGDAILQPGPYDGGRFPDDHIADLLEFIPISFIDDGGLPSDCPIGNSAASLLNMVATVVGSRTRLRAVRTQVGDNLVDAAIAIPLNDADVSDEILDIGTLSGVQPGVLGMAIQKSGRTTGYTTGIIDQVDVTVNVQYGAGRIARFTDQLLAGPMSQGGDSGSAVLDEDKNLVGLLFAGSDTTTIMNRIDNVFSVLNLNL